MNNEEILVAELVRVQSAPGSAELSRVPLRASRSSHWSFVIVRLSFVIPRITVVAELVRKKKTALACESRLRSWQITRKAYRQQWRWPCPPPQPVLQQLV